MKTTLKMVCSLIFLSAFGVSGQTEDDPKGIQWRGISLVPEVSVLGAHDSRVRIDENGKAESDYYSELVAGAVLENLPARYDLSAGGRYGYRYYSDNTDLDDDFYKAGGGIASRQNPLKWGLRTEWSKTLNYNTYYNTTTQEQPDSILTDEDSKRWVFRGDVAYERQLSEKTALTPGYAFQAYRRTLSDGEVKEWMTHSGELVFKYVYSPKTILLAGGEAEFQDDDDEDGTIGKVYVGAESRVTDKTSWKVLVGFAAADYDESGTDQSGFFNLRGLWKATEKVSVYVFGGNDYQPGYNGSDARLVYRAGYGVRWRVITRLSVSGQILHDYEKSVESDDDIFNGVRNFISAQCAYDITRKLLLSLNGRYVDDEFDENQTVFGLKLSYRY
jgi:hypothetical protein